ncbi:MAG: ABC transporter ATP-binding protein [Acidimicrobiales bacterium]
MSADEAVHQSDAPASAEPAPMRPPAAEARPGGGGRFHSVGVPTERSKDFKGTSSRLIERMRVERVGVITVLFLAVCSAVAVVLGPKVLGRATDTVFEGIIGRNGADGIDFGKLHRILLLAIVLYVTSYALSCLQAYLLAGIVQRTMNQLRNDVEAKLNRLPLGYVDRQPRGDLLSRVTNDIDNVAQSLQQTLSQLLTSALTITGVLVMMIWISPLLSLVAIVTVPLSIYSMKTIAGRSKSRFMAQWKHTGALNAQVEEVFTGHAIVRAFGRQEQARARFAATNEQMYQAGFEAQFASGSIQPMMMFLGNLGYVAIAVIGGIRVSHGALGVGDVQAFIQYQRQFTMPLTQFASMINVLQSGIASAERVFELLDAPEQSPDPGPSGLPVPARGRVEFEHVSFRYVPDRPLITDLSLVAEPGTTVAIVGPTGAGKTTLVNLLMRFYELDEGRITLDGFDIAQMPRAELRDQLGMVLQDTWLFGGTIFDNVKYGNPSATDEQVYAAARAAYVDRFAHMLPHGYDTVIDDEGGNVSAGEKQLITIARAFLSDPSILILDEATSSVDTRTEVLIQHAMAALRSSRTSFVIAHRLSTIRDADIILVMDAGRIVEQGNHRELLARQGAYYTLYQSQFAGAATDLG